MLVFRSPAFARMTLTVCGRASSPRLSRQRLGYRDFNEQPEQFRFVQ